MGRLLRTKATGRHPNWRHECRFRHHAMQSAGKRPKLTRPPLLKLQQFWEKLDVSTPPDYFTWLGLFDNWLALQEAQRPGAQKFSPSIHCRSLFQHLGSEACCRLERFFANDIPPELNSDVDLLRTTLSTLFTRKLDSHLAHFCFFGQKQELQESSADFLADLRTLAKCCCLEEMG